jgi:hypothetical protein
MTDCEWSDDNLIDELVDRITAEFRELILEEYFFGEHPNDPGFDAYFNNARTKFAVDAYAFITLSPPKIWDTYHDIGAAAGETFVGELNAAVKAIDASIGDWEGPAAEAFSKHVGHIQTFVNNQASYVNVGVQRLAAAYKLAVQARNDYKSFVERWIHASQDCRSSKREQDLEVQLKVGVGIVSSIVSVAPIYRAPFRG